MVSKEDAESRSPTSGSSNISGDHRQYHHKAQTVWQSEYISLLLWQWQLVYYNDDRLTAFDPGQPG